MTTYNWQILNLDRRTADGFVTTAHWTCTGEDEGITSSIYATCSFDGDLAIPYEDLTQETVLGWCWANGVDKDATEASIAARIAELKAPKTTTGLPW